MWHLIVFEVFAFRILYQKKSKKMMYW